MKRAFEVGVLIFFIVGLTGCARAAAGTQPPRPPEVEVTEAQQKDVPIQREWVGTLDGTVNAAIKAQVTGYLLTQNYSEGAFVNKGQLLFEIDPRPFQAALDQTQGQFSQANGQLAQAKALQKKRRFLENKFGRTRPNPTLVHRRFYVRGPAQERILTG